MGSTDTTAGDAALERLGRALLAGDFDEAVAAVQALDADPPQAEPEAADDDLDQLSAAVAAGDVDRAVAALRRLMGAD